ncbi:aldolase [Priestia aryabhattai]|uniref:aldolase n=1 Tax=Priestia TaxID=2800373 RepID=UPI001455522E|nr:MULTISPECIES: aldolase [Priestia]MBY0007033.1 aldolase [Priestia aryabhattai]MBY0048537.1 aldolase [Priestia aryabhattai]MEB4869791.1 aldolase [Priestia megaterium]MED3951903.1 aldolase [Priestia aryabhattai]MED4393079.1 aldolase [Priestia aryabhattai]
MIDTVKRTAYKAFGLTVSSELSLPELLQAGVDECEVDVVIKEADLFGLWSERSVPDDDFVIQENSVMFHIPETAFFLVENGNEILFSPMEGAHEDELRLYILGTCMGTVLLQRNILPLHGSAIAIDNKVYAIVGESGAGKSTLASAFLKRGYQLLSDDVIAITVTDENVPVVIPAYPQQKLWMESLNEFKMESSNYRPIIDRETKFAIPVQSQFANQPLPLAGVFELVKTDGDEIELHCIQKLERFYTLYTHTYRNFFVQKAGLMEWHFSTLAKIINKIELYQLRRPTSRFTAHDLSDLILATLNKGEVLDD